MAPAWPAGRTQAKGGIKGPTGPGKGAAALRPAPPPGARTGAPVKRAPPGVGAIQPSSKAQKVQDTIVVYSTAEKDEIGIRTLVGEYQEEGSNHGKKFYKKTQKIPGHEDVEVFLYFWDSRDGPAFQGWWFGNQVGGSQVWSRNTEAGPVPPRTGWTIPWDGPVKKEIVVESTEQKSAAERRQAAMQVEARRAQENTAFSQAQAQEWEDRVQRATERAAEVEIGIEEGLEAARQVLEGEPDDQAVLEAQKDLAAQAAALAETQRAIATEGLAAQKAPPELKAELVALGGRLRAHQATIKEEMGKLKDSKATRIKTAEEQRMKEEEESRVQELEGLHGKQLEEMLPAAMDKTSAAEDEVEKVAIASAPLAVDTTDDLRPVMMQAIKETEQRVRAAQAAIGEARRFISAKLSAVGRFAPAVKKTAVEEFTALQEKLNEAQSKLNPFKTVRQDYEQKIHATQLHEELSSKLSGAEVEVEKAAMMVAPLGGDNPEAMKEAEVALGSAQSSLSQTSRLIESKLKSVGQSPSPLWDEIKALRDRARQAQEKLDDVRKTVKETQVRIAADNLLREVSEKVSNAEDELQVMAEAELPFLRGDQGGKDLETLLADADQTASKVHTALAEAQTFVAKKMVEVARFTEGPARTVKEEVDALNKRMEDGRARLQQFRASTAERKRSHLLEDVENKVSGAEDEVRKMMEATQALAHLGAPGDTVAEGAQEAVEQASLAERAAQASIVNARKHLLQRTAELKKLAMAGASSGSELGRLQTRVNSMQQDIAKLRSATKDAEERLRVKQMLAEVVLRLRTTEGEVDKVAADVVPQGGEAPSAESVERLDKRMSSCKTKLSTTAKLVEVKLKTAEGVLKEELSAMRSKCSAAERKLDKVIGTAKEQRERLETADLIASAVEFVEKADRAVQRCTEEELPFLKGIEALASGEALRAIAACDAAAHQAQKTITEARTFVIQKLGDAKAFSEGPAEACTKELLASQKRLDGLATRLNELKKDTAQRKLKSQMQACSEKVSGVESAVQKLADTMGKYGDERVDKMSPEEACAMCEEVALAEEDAQVAVTDARKYLAQRTQEAKAFAEALRAPMTAELAKLQGRLTQCQVELAKLSQKCTEREQRFVARTLVQQKTAALEELQAEVRSAKEVAAPLLADDRAPFLRALELQTVVAALQAHRKASGQDAGAIFSSFAQGGAASTSELAAFLKGLPELAGKEDAAFSDEQWDTVASAAGKGGKVTAASLGELMRERMICVSATPVSDAAEGGKVCGSLMVGEGVELVGQAVAKDGSKQAHCVLARDGSAAWAPMQSLRPSPPHAGRVESMEAHVAGVLSKAIEEGKVLDQKVAEVSAAKQGPLAEVKAKLLEIRAKVTQEQAKADTLRKQASAAGSGIQQEQKAKMQGLQEARCKAFAKQSIAEGAQAVEDAEAAAARATESAKATSPTSGMSQLDAALREADAALKQLADAKGVVTRNLASHEAYKGSSRNLLLEARVALTKLGSRATAAERKLSAAVEAVRAAHGQAAKAATQKARSALRAAARKSGKSVDELFDEVSKGSGEIGEARFAAFVKGLPDQDLTPEQVSLVFGEMRMDGRVSRVGFGKALQLFCRCDRETAITDALDMEGASVVRKLEQGELIEVLEGPETDAKTQAQRVRGRALRDGTSGWVTLKGGQGAPFLKPREKPFLCATGEADLRAEFGASSSVLRKLAKDEVLELLEGPRSEAVACDLVVRAQASSDGTEGFLTLKDAAGTSFAASSTGLYVSRSAIAMTDNFDIDGCKVVRKVDVGEALEKIGEAEKADTERAITRLRFRALRDGKEGWVTLKGNQGTVYVEASTSHYVVSREAALRESAAGGSVAVRPLKVGEAVEALDAPQEVRPEAAMGLRMRALKDGETGWVVYAAGAGCPLKPWKV